MRFRVRLALLLALACAAVAAFTAGGAFAATAAPGFAVSNWSTANANNGSVGPVGIAADPNSPNDIYVMNYASGTLFKYDQTAGGVEGPAHQVSATGAYGGNNAAGIAFDKDGKLYVAFQGWWAVGEISKADGHLIRTLSGPYGYFYCATGIATDPLSGDLFVTSPCGWGIIRVPTSGSGGMAFGPAIDGITFGPDGTIWGEGGGTVYKMPGTNQPGFGTYTSVAYVPTGDGISVAAASDNPALPPYIFVVRNDGIITKVDLSGPTPAYTDIVSGGTRGDFSTVGFDGCLYATQTDRVIKVTNADGSCSLAPVTPDDVTSLVLGAPASEDFADPVTVTASLKNVTKSMPLSGQTVTFTLGSATCSAVTDMAGVASCSITVADPAGPATLTAQFAHQPKLAPATATKPFTITLEETTLAYTGVQGAIQNGSTATLSGLLKEDATTPLAGRTVTFALGAQGCSAVTNAAGVASCSVVVSQPSGPAPISASFAGDAWYLPASDTAAATISAASVLAYTGDTTGNYHDPATLSAKLTSLLSGTPIAGATVSFTLGALACTDTTNASGVASCSVTPNTAAGPQPVTASFAGDSAFDPSSDSATFQVTKEQTATVYTGSTATILNGSSLVLSGTLKEDGVTPIAGRTVTLSIGSGASLQSCTDTTSAAGAASCTVTLAQPAGVQPLAAAFAGDAYYLASSDSSSLTVYSARSVKQAAVTALTDLGSATSSKDDDHRIASAIRQINRSLNTAWWNPDGIHLTLQGCQVFDYEKSAASQLQEQLKSKKFTAAQKAGIQVAISLLVQADQILASTALDEAIAGNGNAKKIALANKAMAKAAALLAAGKPDEAINQYRIAWEKAQESLGRKVCGDDGHEDEDGHEGHHDNHDD